MKVAIITESFPKLSETFVVNHIKGLIDAGVQVQIFALNRLAEGKVHPVVQEYRLQDITKYKTETVPGKLQRFIRGAGLFFQYILAYPGPVLRSLNFFKFRKEALNLGRLLEVSTFFTKEKFDIVHCHFGTTAEKIALYQQWGLLNAPLVTSFHGFDVDDRRIRKENRYDELKKKGALYISNSVYTKKRIVELGFDKKKINVLPVFFDTGYFKKKQKTSNPVFHLLTVGRLVEFKGIEFSIRALALVKEKFQVPFQYTIVGTGPLKEQVQSLIQELNMDDCIELAGHKTQDEILELMEASAVFLLTGVSATDGRVENQGLVIQEAQAMELPVIVSNVGGVAEGMIDGQTGYLLKQKDIEAIAEKIYFLYLNPEERIKMGKAGRAFVQYTYSIPFSTKQLIMYYKNLINRDFDN